MSYFINNTNLLLVSVIFVLKNSYNINTYINNKKITTQQIKFSDNNSIKKSGCVSLYVILT